MRVLMMISNNNMGVRAVYTSVLQSRFPGWGLSHMSGLPPNPAYILKAYDVLVYELGKPDDPSRYKATLALWDELKELQTIRMVTHIEGPYREGIVAELQQRGIVCVDTPFTPQAIADALDRVAPQRRGKERTAASREDAPAPGPSPGGRLRGLFRSRRKEQE